MNGFEDVKLQRLLCRVQYRVEGSVM